MSISPEMLCVNRFHIIIFLTELSNCQILTPMRRLPRKTEAELLKELQAITDKRRGLTAAAERYGMTIQFISDVVYGRRGVSEKLAEKMGYRKIVEYEKVA